jgi:signal peptidase I
LKARRGLSAVLWRLLGVAKVALEVAVLAAALWLFVFQVSVVSGHSMDPSLEPGDRLVVDKLCYHWCALNRFDVVVFERPRRISTGIDRIAVEGSGIDYVKRVVGLPGETVELRRGELYVGGVRVEQDFRFEDDASSFGPVTVPADSVFVLGDNRSRSLDSRSWDIGSVPSKFVKGVARFRVYPFGRAGSL